MKPLIRSILVLLTLSLATPAALAQSGGGANIGGAANTAEGTGRGAGGPGDGQGPGQGAGQGLGPGGRDKNAEREQAEKEKKERAQRDKEAREKKEREKREREQAEREKKQREKEEREAKEKADNEKKEAEQKEREQREREKTEREQREREEKEKADNEKKQREQEEREAKEKADNEKKEAEQKEREQREREKTEREQREREEKEKADNEKKQRETEENRPPEEPAKPEPPAGEPTKPKDKPTPPAAPAKTDDTPPAGPSGPTADPEPRRPLPPGRDNPVTPLEQTRLDVPSVPSRGDLPSAPSVPTSPGSLVPGGRVDEVLGTSPSSAVDRFFGIFTGGGKRAAATTVTTGKGIVALERPAAARRARGAFLGIFRPEFPNLPAATKVRQVAVDTRVTSPRTVTYKSRLSRVSRWIGPLTLGLLNYVPFETMNAAVAGRINNLMAEEEISVEKLVARLFEEGVRDGKRYVLAKNPQAVFELEMTRYALDPMPTSLGRVKPTVSVTGRLYDNNGQLLWIGKGFSTIAEPGLKGANVEHYEANPAQLRADFETATRVAMSRLVAQANAVPKASVKVTAAE